MTDPTTPGTKPRPTAVTVSSYLLYLYAALGLIGAIISLSVVGTITDVYREAYEGTDAEGFEGFATATTVGAAVLSLLFALAFVVLAIFNNRGKNPARIVTWVLGGISLCCSGFGLVGSALSGSMGTGSANGDVPDPAEVQRRLEDALPSWYTPATITLGVLSLLALLVALILLALPPSNEFFRKPAPVWEPPVPGAAYPSYPQVPPSGSGTPGAGPGADQAAGPGGASQTGPAGPAGTSAEQSGPASAPPPSSEPPSSQPPSSEPPSRPTGA